MNQLRNADRSTGQTCALHPLWISTKSGLHTGRSIRPMHMPPTAPYQIGLGHVRPRRDLHGHLARRETGQAACPRFSAGPRPAHERYQEEAHRPTTRRSIGRRALCTALPALQPGCRCGAWRRCTPFDLVLSGSLDLRRRVSMVDTWRRSSLVISNGTIEKQRST